MANEELLEQEEAYVLSLTDEDGNEVEFELIESLDYNGVEYLVLLPMEEDAEDVVILEVVPGANDTETYVTVDNEETLMAVFEIFKDHFKDSFTFED